MARLSERKILSRLSQKGVSPSEKAVLGRQMKRLERQERVARIKIKRKKAETQAIKLEEIKATQKEKEKPKAERKAKSQGLIITQPEAEKAIAMKMADFKKYLDVNLWWQPHAELRKEILKVVEGYLWKNPTKRINVSSTRLFKIAQPTARPGRTAEQAYFKVWRQYALNQERRRFVENKLNVRLGLGVEKNLPSKKS